MEFKIEKKESLAAKNYSSEDLEIARDFSRKVMKEFDKFVKSVVLFGSAAREKIRTSQDIDVLVIVDDLSMVITPEAVEAYRIIMQRLVGETNKRIHLTTLKITNFWDLVRNGDPVAVNILRDGVALSDSGIFDPLQALLYQGRIIPSKESINSYIMRAPMSLQSSKWKIMDSVLDMYWAVIDSAHAALMSIGEVPPTPAHVADLIEEKLVKRGLLEKKYAVTMTNFYNLSKKILHREISELKPRDLEVYQKDASEFVERMKKLIER